MRLPRAEEKHEIKIAGATFTYRRIGFIKKAELRKSCSVKGIVDEEKFVLALMEYCLLGWKNVVDIDGTEIPFNKEVFGEFPDTIVATLVLSFTSPIVEEKKTEELKN
jgi:hypothetical protein